MKRLLSIIIFLLIWIGSTFSQTVVIPDVAFRNFLATQFPSYFNGQLEMNIDSAASFSGGLNCSGLGISDLDGIQYFTGITQLNCAENNLTALPSFEDFNALTQLECNKNQITAITGIDSLPVLNTILAADNDMAVFPVMTYMPELNVIDLDNNELSTVPDLTGVSSLTTLRLADNNLTFVGEISVGAPLQTLWLKNNNLSALPDLSAFDEILDVQLYGNSLTFEDLVPLSTFTNFLGFGIDPQNAVTFEVPEGVVEMDAVSIDPGFDASVASNVYQWKSVPGGEVVSTERVLSFDSLSLEDGGTYYLEVTNSTFGLGSLTLTSEEFDLIPAECFDSAGAEVLAVYTCESQGSITVTGATPAKGELSVLIYNENGELTGDEHLPQGSYSVYISNGDRCTMLLAEVTIIAQDCDNIFTPDGDGINDEFYIELEGEAKVYAPGGQLIRAFKSPGAWDGKDERGKRVALDLYTIVVNGTQAIQVTVVR